MALGWEAGAYERDRAALARDSAAAPRLADSKARLLAMAAAAEAAHAMESAGVAVALPPPVTRTTPAAADPPPPRTSRRAQREAAEARRAAADKRHRDRARERQVLRGALAAEGSWPLAVRVMATDVLADPSGKSVLGYMAQLRRTHSGTPIWAIVRAALRPLDGDAGYRRTWRDPCARAIAVLGFAQLMCSKPTKRRSQWRRVVRGFNLANWAALLRSPWEADRRPSFSTLSHHYLPALRAAGFMYSQQLPAHEVEPWECGVDRDFTPRAYNRYWIVGLAAVDDFETQLRLQVWHDAGWAACETPPTARATAPP